MRSAAPLDLHSFLSAGHMRLPSPRLRARLAGALYFLAVVIAVYAEFVAPGRLGASAIILPIACSALVTLLLFSLFHPVHANLAWTALFSNLSGLAFEALELHPLGVNLGMVLHGVAWILFGALVWQSWLLPRIFGLSMALAGIIWLLYVAPPLVHRLAPFNTAAGLLCEAVPMLWFLIMGVRPQHTHPLPSALEVQS